jgi:ferredoxin
MGLLLLVLLARALTHPDGDSVVLSLYPKFQPGQIIAGLFSHGNSAFVLSFLVYAVLTALFGRFFCAFLCPLGAGLEAAVLLRGFAKPKGYSYRRSGIWRSVVPFSLLLLFWAGITFPYGALEPYSVVAGAGYFGFRPSLALLVVLGSGYFLGRGFCNFLCPTGFILRLLSRRSLFGMRFKEGCVSCGKCAKACPASCVDYRNRKLDAGRCVLCLECASLCPAGTLSYGREAKAALGKAAAAKTDAAKTDAGKVLRRRAFLVRGALGAAAAAAYLTGEKARAEMLPELRRFPVLPPGALSLAHLNAHCTLCHTCLRACPNQALHPCENMDLALWRKPVLVAARGFCQYECVKCTRVCPTGALVRISVEEKRVWRLAQVRLKKESCVVITRETSCGACAEICPTGAVYMADGLIPGRPEPYVKPEYCVGCGACQKVCPVEPMPAIWISGLKYQDMLAQRAPKAEGPDAVLEDFPF